jgi:transposase
LKPFETTSARADLILTCNQYDTKLAARNTSTFRRLQCLWLRGQQDLATDAIAQTVGLSVSHVRRVWSDYLRGGLAAAQGRPKGGRRHQNLTVTQEQALLAPLHQQAQAGDLVTVARIKRRYQARLGHAVPDSTVYRVLARHQWRQVQPRPKHPREDPRAHRAFEKTPGQSGRRGGWARREPWTLA